MPEVTELNNPENWVHLNPNILQAGRVTHFVDHPNEEERQQQLDTLNESDPVDPRLKALAEEKPMEGYENNWNVKSLGDNQVFNLVGAEEGNTNSY